MGKYTEGKKRILYTKLAKYYDYLVPSTTKEECSYLDNVFKKFSKGQISKILDLGCGTGRHTSFLQKMDYKVTGIDLSTQMLEVARRRSPDSTFIKMNFIYPEFDNNFFDASICMWSTIGYILDSEKFREFAKNVSEVTKELFVFSSTNHESDSFQPNEIVEKVTHIPGGKIINKMTRSYDVRTGIREENYEYSITENGKRTDFTDKNKLRLWKVDEIKSLLSPEFTILKICGNYTTGDIFSRNSSDKKIIVARKE